MSELDDTAPTGTKSVEAPVIHSLNNLMSQRRSSVLDGVDLSVHTPSSTFDRFQELPNELRLKIWKLALPGPRLVDISGSSYLLSVRINSHRSMPSILHVCSESRQEALQWYTKLPQGLTPDAFRASYINSDAFRASYINFEIDTLYFSNVWDFRTCAANCAENGLGMEQVTNNLRFLALTERAWETPARSKKAIGFIQRFGKLEELTYVSYDDGVGEITDESVLDVWDELQIGDEVGVAIRTSAIPISDDNTGYLEWIKRAVTTRECGGLKNIKVRIVVVQRTGQDLRQSDSDSDGDSDGDSDDWEEEIHYDINGWDSGWDSYEEF